MARTENLLTVLQVKRAQPGAVLRDGGGLYLDVSRATGAKIWRWDFRLAGKQNIFTIGETELGAARIKRDEARELVKRGLNPTTERKIAAIKNIDNGAETFEKNARDWLKAYTPRVSSKTHLDVTRAVDYVVPFIGKLPIRDVRGAHVRDVLLRWADRPHTAKVIRQTISKVFQFATIDLDLSHDPTFVCRRLIPASQNNHHPWLDMNGLHDFMTALDECDGSDIDKLGTKILALTLVRPENLASAQWKDFDLDGATWRIPAKAMKKTAPHIVPLSRQAVAFLRELRAISKESPVLFPLHFSRVPGCDGPRPYQAKGRGLLPVRARNANIFQQTIARTRFHGPDAVKRVSAHGLRATASTFLNESGQFRTKAIEIQLAHTARGQGDAIELVYNHAKYMDERVAMMQFYADAVFPPTKRKGKSRPARSSNVLPFRQAA